MKTAVIAGSTGLAGSYLLRLLLASPDYSKVITLTRRDPSVTNAKLVQVKTMLSQLREDIHDLTADDVFCCLGTTIAKAGSREKFYEVDFQYPLELAKITKDAGASSYHLVTALGANPRSRLFYNKVKGEVEEAVSKIGFESLHIYRPSLLTGPRTERRVAEDFANLVFRVLGFLVPASYKPVHASQVAAAMMHYASTGNGGIWIHSSAEIRKFSTLVE